MNGATKIGWVVLATASLCATGCAEGTSGMPSSRPGPDNTSDAGTNAVADGSTIQDASLPPNSDTDGGTVDPGPFVEVTPSISAALISPGLWEITIDEGTFQLENGQEGTWCVRLPIPAELRDKELAVVGADYDLPVGTHHYFMAYSRNERAAIEPCVADVGNLLPLEGEAMELEDPGLYLAGFPRGVGGGDMREGFGLYMSPNGHFVTNHHVLNITGQTLNMHGRFKFRVKERSSVRRIMRPLNCLNQAIRVEPGQTVDVTATCVATSPIEVVQLGSHAHQHLDLLQVRVFRGGQVSNSYFDVYSVEHGENLAKELAMVGWRYPLEFELLPGVPATITLEFLGPPVSGGQVTSEVIYESSEWDAPAGVDRTANPIALARGDGLTYTCRYTNPKNVPVIYGVHEDEEMCATMNLYVLPDTAENASVVPPSLASIVNFEPGYKDTPQPNTVNVLVDTNEVRKIYPGEFAF